MSDPPSSSSSSNSLFGSSLLDQSKAHPGNIDLSIIQPKSKPVSQGTTSSDYLQKTCEDNPEPKTDDNAKAKVQLSKCKFETPVDQLVLSEPFEMSCEVKATTSEVPTALRVTFCLFVSYENDKGATVKEDLKASWNGFLEAKTESQTVKAKGALYRPNAPLGTKLQCKLIAEHMECSDKAESPVADVVAKIQIQSVSLTGDHFLSDGIVPLLHTDEKLPEILAQAIGAALAKGPVGEEGTLLIQGHFPSGSEGEIDRSDLRARMIKTQLEKDANSWATLAVMHGTESEFFQNLSALAKLGWDCDPSVGKDAAHEGFKQEVKARCGLAVQEPTLAKNCLEDPAKVSKTAIPAAKGGGKGTVGAEKASLPEPLPGEAPWMEFAIEEAKRWKGAKEDVISQSINYHKEIGVPIHTMVGGTQAWCASFANYCLKKAGYPIVSPDPAKTRSFFGASDFHEITEPQCGCIVISDNTHTGFVVGKYRNGGSRRSRRERNGYNQVCSIQSKVKIFPTENIFVQSHFKPVLLRS